MVLSAVAIFSPGLVETTRQESKSLVLNLKLGQSQLPCKERFSFINRLGSPVRVKRLK